MPLPPVLSVSINLPEDLSPWLASFHVWLEPSVRLYETDANGHMSQLTYFGWQEWAGTEYWARLGRPELVASQAETSWFMGEQYCRFLAEVNYGHTVRLGVRCARLGRSSATFEYAFLRPDRRLAAAGLNSQVLVDVASRQSVAIPDDLRAAVERREAGE